MLQFTFVVVTSVLIRLLCTISDTFLASLWGFGVFCPLDSPHSVTGVSWRDHQKDSEPSAEVMAVVVVKERVLPSPARDTFSVQHFTCSKLNADEKSGCCSSSHLAVCPVLFLEAWRGDAGWWLGPGV